MCNYCVGELWGNCIKNVSSYITFSLMKDRYKGVPAWIVLYLRSFLPVLVTEIGSHMVDMRSQGTRDQLCC